MNNTENDLYTIFTDTLDLTQIKELYDADGKFRPNEEMESRFYYFSDELYKEENQSTQEEKPGFKYYYFITEDSIHALLCFNTSFDKTENEETSLDDKLIISFNVLFAIQEKHKDIPNILKKAFSYVEDTSSLGARVFTPSPAGKRMFEDMLTRAKKEKSE